MTVHTPAGASEGTGAPRYDYDDEQGEGWVMFAGVMLTIVGFLNVIGGIAAIDNANFWVGNAQFMFSDLNTWGWVLVVLGAVQLVVALGVWARNGFARWMGVLFASANAVAQLLVIQAYPFWSLAIFTLDILIVYGLVAYGGRLQRA